MPYIIAQIQLFFKQFLEILGNLIKDDKLFQKVFLAIFCLCFSVSSFFLGRISKIFQETPATNIEFFDAVTNKNSEEDRSQVTNLPNKDGNIILASKKGKKYYFLWCKASQNIKLSNRIYFKTEEDAKKRGLTLANNCK
jgi:hypothetical protein